jgi:hypothetical protein
MVLEAARIPGTQVTETTIARNATISMNDVDGGPGTRHHDTAGSYIPVTLGEDFNISLNRNDITEEEIISIEDTYRETAAAGLVGSYNEFSNQNNDQESGSQPYANKSMTVIHEEDGEYEES